MANRLLDIWRATATCSGGHGPQLTESPAVNEVKTASTNGIKPLGNRSRVCQATASVLPSGSDASVPVTAPR